ncbi:DUF1877 family protein [Spirillospora sp. CA-108201]
MIGYYARRTPAELDRMIREPASARRLASELVTAERVLNIDKAWDRIGDLLDEFDFPVDVVYGEEILPGSDGWGPLGYLTSKQVQEAAEALLQFRPETLVTEFFTPRSPVQAGTDPHVIRERSGVVDYVLSHFESLAAFIQTAARAHDAIIMWQY